MYKKIVAFVALSLMFATGAFANEYFNLDEDRFYSPNPTTIRTVTANYTAVKSDHEIDVDTTSGAITITLPTIINTLGGNQAYYIIRNIGTTGYAVTVTAATTDAVTNTIEGAATRLLSSPIVGTSTIMNVALRNGYDWKVLWETPPFYMSMLTGNSVIGQGAFMRSVVVTGPTTSITLTPASYCGRIIPVSTDALTLTLPAAGAVIGCTMEFINAGAAGGAIIDIKASSTDAFYGTLHNPVGTSTIVSSSTGSTLSNTKTTAKTGDYVRLVSISTGSWVFTSNTGTWTTK